MNAAYGGAVRADTQATAPADDADEKIRDVGRGHLVSLMGVLGLAFALRLWGLSWGLPNEWSLDEVHRRDAALDHGIPRLTLAQPGFVLNSLFVIYRVAEGLGVSLGDSEAIYLGRLFMAVLGVLTVLGVWLLARELADKDKPGPAIPAALLAAVLPFTTTTSRYIKEDGPLAFMTVFLVLAVVRYWKVPSWGRLALLGFAAGAAFSTKFAAVALFPVVGIALLAAAKRDKLRLTGISGRLCLVAGAAVVGLFLVSPQYLTDPGQVVRGFAYQLSNSQRGSHDGITIPISAWSQWWTYFIRHGLLPGMTWPVFLVALAGAVPLLRRPAGWTVVSSAVVIYLVMENSSDKPAPFAARYLTPLVPLLCVQAGFGIQAILRRFAVWGRPKLGLAACTAVFIIPPAVISCMIADEATHDTRTIAGAWMDAHFPPGTKIALVDSRQYRPAAKGWGDVDIWRIDNRRDKWDPSGTGDPPPYFVLSSFRFQRYLDYPEADPQRTAYFRHVMGYHLVKKFEPRWRTYGFHSPTLLIYQDRQQAPQPSMGSQEGDRGVQNR